MNDALRGLLLLLVTTLPLAASDDEASTIADLAARAKSAVVIVSYSDRDGQPAGVGSGFVIGADGLIATNLHVIGEARPITVRFADGTSHAVTSVHATDRGSDLAVLRIDAARLDALELGDAESVREGQELVALGHPLGLEYSVVRGVLSGRREIEGRSLLQIAVPVERGNSGGPVLDASGKVVGLLSMKSSVTDNLGFAVPINALRPLLESPNPVPIERWLTIGRIDPKSWTPKFGGNWRQRAGRIQVDGPGDGFGGRTLLLSQQDAPEIPFELAVTVRLEEESGAAGLVWSSDGDERHYGFYPSAGGLRLSRFDGPDVFGWQVLEQVSSRAYRPGQWNTLKVRVEADRVACFVNESKVIDWNGQAEVGRIGLAAFRGTKAEFKRFRVADELPSGRPDQATTRRILDAIADLDVERPPDRAVEASLQAKAAAAEAVLEVEAQRLERRAQWIRQLASGVRRRDVLEDLKTVAEAESPDLLRGALLIAKLDNDEIDVESYLEAASRIADEAKKLSGEETGERNRLAALNRLLFEQLGFHGSRTNYEHRSNSYLNEVIDDREGLPIALGVLYIELAKHLDLKVEGVGLPGHFVVRFVPADGDSELIDVFAGGKAISRKEAESLASQPLDDRAFAAMEPKVILERMLRNLINLARADEDSEAMLRYTEAVLILRPESAQDRLMHAFVCMNTDRFEEAIAECDRLLDDRPEGVDLERVSELRTYIERRKRESDGGS